MVTSVLLLNSIKTASDASAAKADVTMYYEDLQAGQRWVSPDREITRDDVSAFVSLTGDFVPLHTAAL